MLSSYISRRNSCAAVSAPFLHKLKYFPLYVMDYRWITYWANQNHMTFFYTSVLHNNIFSIKGIVNQLLLLYARLSLVFALSFLLLCCLLRKPFLFRQRTFSENKKMYLLSASKLKISAKRVLKTVKLGIEYQCLWSAYTTCQVVLDVNMIYQYISVLLLLFPSFINVYCFFGL